MKHLSAGAFSGMVLNRTLLTLADIMTCETIGDGAFMRNRARRASALAFACLLLFSFLLISPVSSAAQTPARSYSVLVQVQDAGGHPVPDVLLTAAIPKGDFNKNINDTLNHTQEGFSDAAGRWRTTLRLSAGETTPPSALLTAYTPYWSASAPPQPMPKTSGDEISYTFVIPQNLATYRVRTLDYQNQPISGVQVRLFSPYSIIRASDSGGLVFFRLPPNSSVTGQVESGNSSQNFTFPSVSDSDQALEVPIQLPLRHPVPNPYNATFNYSAQILESSGRAWSNQPIGIEVGRMRWTFVSDKTGSIYLRQFPYESINLTWIIYNYTYRQEVNLSRPMPVIRTPLLLTIAAYAPIPLGDSCYRMLVNVTDPRNHPLLQVNAKPVSGDDLIPFSLDHEETINGSLQFSRVLCVDTESTFDIIASNPFERAVLQVHLQAADAPPPAVSIYAREPPPKAATKTAVSKEDQKKLELVLLLVYVLVMLVVLFVAVRFRGVLLYYFQSILRFTYTSMRKKPSFSEETGEEGAAGSKGAQGRGADAKNQQGTKPPEQKKPVK